MGGTLTIGYDLLGWQFRAAFYPVDQRYPRSGPLAIYCLQLDFILATPVLHLFSIQFIFQVYFDLLAFSAPKCALSAQNIFHFGP